MCVCVCGVRNTATCRNPHTNTRTHTQTGGKLQPGREKKNASSTPTHSCCYRTAAQTNSENAVRQSHPARMQLARGKAFRPGRDVRLTAESFCRDTPNNAFAGISGRERKVGGCKGGEIALEKGRHSRSRCFLLESEPTTSSISLEDPDIPRIFTP